MKKNTEVIHKEVKGGTKMINCYLRENQSGFSETRRLTDLIEQTLIIDARTGAAQCVG